MDNSTRLQYLSAMGIDVWVAKGIQQTAASTVDNWSKLNETMRTCQQCDLCQSRQQVLVGTGNQHADFMWISSAPSHADEQQGMAFADDAARLFTEMLRAMQLSREQVFITHLVKCRPSDDRDPTQQELEACAVFLQRQIVLLRPQVLIAVGAIAAQQLLHSKTPLAELSGIEHQFLGIPLIILHHPSDLLHSMADKAQTWQAMQRALSLLNKTKNNAKTSIQST